MKVHTFLHYSPLLFALVIALSVVAFKSFRTEVGPTKTGHSDRVCKRLCSRVKACIVELAPTVNVKNYPGFDSGCFAGCKKQAKMIPDCLTEKRLSCQQMMRCMQGGIRNFNLKKM